MNQFLERLDRAVSALIQYAEEGAVNTSDTHSLLLDVTALIFAVQGQKDAFCELDEETTSATYLKTAEVLKCFSDILDTDVLNNFVNTLLSRESGDVDEIMKQCLQTIAKEASVLDHTLGK